MHSGIGDARTLGSLGITPTLNLPSVGKNLTEHPISAIMWRVNSTNTFESFSRDPSAATAAEKLWNATHTGPLTTSLTNQLGFFRLPNTHTIFKSMKDPASGPTTPHYEFIFSVCKYTLSPPSPYTAGLPIEWLDRRPNTVFRQLLHYIFRCSSAYFSWVICATLKPTITECSTQSRRFCHIELERSFGRCPVLLW